MHVGLREGADTQNPVLKHNKKKSPIPLPRLATVLVWVRREFSVTLPIARQSENGSEGQNTFVNN